MVDKSRVSAAGVASAVDAPAQFRIWPSADADPMVPKPGRCSMAHSGAWDQHPDGTWYCPICTGRNDYVDRHGDAGLQDHLLGHALPEDVARIVRAAPDGAAEGVRFLWAEGGAASEPHYHVVPDCPWLAVALRHGGTLVTSYRPPSKATDRGRVFATLRDHGVPIRTSARADGLVPHHVDAPSELCAFCAANTPSLNEPWLRDAEARCATCLCPPSQHAPLERATWTCCVTLFYTVDADGSHRQIWCPCDGYEPPGSEHGSCNWERLPRIEYLRRTAPVCVVCEQKPAPMRELADGTRVRLCQPCTMGRRQQGVAVRTITKPT